MSPREMMAGVRDRVLDKSTPVPLSIGLLIVVGGAIWYASSNWSGVTTQVAALNKTVEAQKALAAEQNVELGKQLTDLSEAVTELKDVLGEMQTDAQLRTMNRWTSLDMHRWARDLARDNPELEVPDVYEYHAPEFTPGGTYSIGSGMTLALPD